MKNRTHEQCVEELKKLLPRWNGDVVWLLRILHAMNEEVPRHEYRVQAFKLYWGLTARGPVSSPEIAEDYDLSRQTIHKFCQATLRRLKHPLWWGEANKHLRDPP